MQQKPEGNEYRRCEETDSGKGAGDSRLVFGAFWTVLFVFTFLVACPWAGFHAVLLGCVGLLVVLCPPVVALPRTWWLLAGVFMVLGAGSFLPASWIEQPGWRKLFDETGIATGPLIVIQTRLAAETFALFLVMLFVGLWLAGHRPSSTQLRIWSLAFTVGVAVYAILARFSQQITFSGGEGHFGFFPNRNHSATYLAMGSICGLGCVLQALRDRRFTMMSVALVSSGVCLWAVAAWSVSRAGVVLSVIGCLLWLAVLGRRYLGRHGLWAIGLMVLAAGGLFLMTDSRVKQRISQTAEIAGSVIGPEGADSSGEGKPEIESLSDLDFRIPTALDTLGMVRDFKWTGIGAGQFRFIFPQYRNLTAVANEVISYHPESDWLWMASETGVPSTLALVALLVLACRSSLSSILSGRHRALRGACLVAALIVPIHGIFDVPGHRISLAWCGAFLFALSMPPASPDQAAKSPGRWPSRIMGFCILLGAAFLIRGQWLGGPQPAHVAGDIASDKAVGLYREDQKRLKDAEAAGLPYRPSQQDDLLEQALGTLGVAVKVVPLDARVRHQQGFIGLHFEDLVAESTEAFDIERVLNPTSVRTPLLQGVAWSRADPGRAVSLWKESLLRAKRLDEKRPESSRFVENTRSEIRHAAQGNTQLESLIERLDPDEENR